MKRGSLRPDIWDLAVFALAVLALSLSRCTEERMRGPASPSGADTRLAGGDL